MSGAARDQSAAERISLITRRPHEYLARALNGDGAVHTRRPFDELFGEDADDAWREWVGQSKLLFDEVWLNLMGHWLKTWQRLSMSDWLARSDADIRQWFLQHQADIARFNWICFGERSSEGFFRQWAAILDRVRTRAGLYKATDTLLFRALCEWVLLDLSRATFEVGDEPRFKLLVEALRRLDLLPDVKRRRSVSTRTEDARDQKAERLSDLFARGLISTLRSHNPARLDFQKYLLYCLARMKPRPPRHHITQLTARGEVDGPATQPSPEICAADYQKMLIVAQLVPRLTRKSLEVLSETQQRVFELSILGFDDREIAALLRRAESAVKVRRSQAFAMLLHSRCFLTALAKLPPSERVAANRHYTTPHGLNEEARHNDLVEAKRLLIEAGWLAEQLDYADDSRVRKKLRVAPLYSPDFKPSKGHEDELHG